jgi:hypothetical protein
VTAAPTKLAKPPASVHSQHPRAWRNSKREYWLANQRLPTSPADTLSSVLQPTTSSESTHSPSLSLSQTAINQALPFVTKLALETRLGGYFRSVFENIKLEVQDKTARIREQRKHH